MAEDGNFITDRHCRNVGRLVKMGFRMEDGYSPFNVEMNKRGGRFRISLWPMDGFAMFAWEDYWDWPSLLDALLREGAITQKQHDRYYGGRKDEGNC